MIPRELYPDPQLYERGGWYYCNVNIPTSLYYLFGKANKKRKSLKTSDEGVANRKLWKAANEIYDEFDRKQIEYFEEQDAKFKTIERKLDALAMETIQRFADSFSLTLPELSQDTPLDDLLKAKEKLDLRRDMLTDDHPKSEDATMTPEIMEHFKMIMNFDTPEGVAGTERLPNGFTVKQYRRWGKYRSMAVHTFWQDLLINAAIAQGLEPPVIEEDQANLLVAERNTMEWFFKLAGENSAKKAAKEKGIEFDPDKVVHKFDDNIQSLIDNFDTGFRPRKTENPRPKQLSTFYSDWDKRILRDYDNKSTQNKLKRGIRNFQSAIGDMVIDQVEPHHAYEFLDAILEDRPDVSRSTLSTNIWGCQAFFNFLIEDKGALSINPFNRINLRKRGTKAVEWQRYETDELYTIFQYPWTEDQRLLLAILVTTGMRLEEAVELTWDRYNDTDYQGIKYFSLLSTGEEDPQVKTDSSARYVILHPALDEMLLPRKQESGRLFKWAHNHAGEEINPILKELFNHPRKRIHSFRRTFKILYRDHGVDEKSIDALVGHAEGDKMRKAYAGVGVPMRYDNLKKVEHPWLKAKPKG